MQMLIKLNMSPRNSFQHALCIYIPYIYIPYSSSCRARQTKGNQLQLEAGKCRVRNGRTPIYALMPDQQMFFHYFGLFSPFITCRQQAAAVRAARPGEPQQRHKRNYKWSQGQVKWAARRTEGGQHSEQYYLQNKRVRTSSLEQFVKSPPQLQPFDWAETCGKREYQGVLGRGEGGLFHIKVNEFTTSNCGAKLIEKVYFACEMWFLSRLPHLLIAKYLK